jgi:tRNA(fMet)-specific endonuclease VapC
MVKSAALDTNIAIHILNNDKAIVKKISRIPLLYLPVTVEGELLFGALNSGKSIKNLKAFREFISTCPVLNINSNVANEYAAIRKQLKEAGTPIPENDIWIAATCKTYQLPLATLDKHFKKIKGLTLIKL